MQQLQLCTLNISTTCTGNNYTCYCTTQNKVPCLQYLEGFDNVHVFRLFIYGCKRHSVEQSDQQTLTVYMGMSFVLFVFNLKRIETATTSFPFTSLCVYLTSKMCFVMRQANKYTALPKLLLPQNN